MLNTTTAANDTSAQTTIPRGTTFDGAEWRAHRYADSYQVTRTVNAGKRGKSCEVFTVCAPIRDTDAAMDEVAPAILWAVREGVSVDTMRATLSDLALAGWTFHATTKRGIDDRTCHPESTLENEGRFYPNGRLAYLSALALTLEADASDPAGGLPK